MMNSLTDPQLLESSRVEVLDVRPIVSRGEEPFGTINEHLEELSKEKTLLLVAPFDPRPLKQYVTREGFVFDYWEPSDDMTWMAIYRGEQREKPDVDGAGPSFVVPVPGGVQYVLDCRELSPPLPLEWTSQVLENLGEKDLLVQHNDRRPDLLLDNLDEYEWAVNEDNDWVQIEFTTAS